MRLLRSLFDDRSGNSLLEFGLGLPVLMILLMGGIDIGRYSLASLKMYNAASSMADLASRDDTVSVAKINDLFSAVDHIVSPFDVATDGRVIITGVSADAPDTPEVFWQVETTGGLSATSEIGAPGETATLPASLSIDTSETVIVAEVFYHFTPIFGLVMGDITMREMSYFRPRLGSLRTLE